MSGLACDHGGTADITVHRVDFGYFVVRDP
jgi:hypothetical protein